MFQTDKMNNQGAEYYLQDWELIPGYTVNATRAKIHAPISNERPKIFLRL